MVTCSNCQHTNRTTSNFCKQCGRPIACPRCRVVLERPLNFCDNCGQALALESSFELLPISRPESQPIESSAFQSMPVSAPDPSLVAESAQGSPGTELDRFVPKELMVKLEAARSSGSMVGERRVVTILFCDVAGSTRAAEKLDPEDWTEIINGAFEHMIKPVYEYEGTVARLTGDGILAFFGAPLSHEDDPQRALLAGLDIVSAIDGYRKQVLLDWDIEFNVRVGINTGRVVVGAVGSDLRMEYTAMGDAINLAARMEQTAALGTVQVSDDTYRLVAPIFDFKELGAVEVKGKSEPVLAYQVLQRKASRGRMRGIEGLEINMIGRDRELVNLVSAIDNVQRGIGSIICVIGDAGLGKSRLLRELRKSHPLLRADESPTSESVDDSASAELLTTNAREIGPLWFETSSLSYETAQPYSLFRRLIRRINGISHSDPTEDVRAKLAPLVSYFPEQEESHTLSVLETLFGLDSRDDRPPLEGEAFRRAVFELMPTLWRRRFDSQPVVIVCDDLHWSDPTSISLLQDLLPLTEEMAILFICVFRPERDVPGWQIKNTADEIYHHLYTEINLQPLSENQSNEMIDALLGNPELPAELRGRVLERAEGNPFYIEEVIRTLIDGGAIIPGKRTNGHIRWRVAEDGADIDIPDNLQALLTARIDGLSEDVRHTLQVASVIGRNFYRRVLKMINDATDEFDIHIQTLLRQEMIRESARVPEIEYRFSNPLTQEAAYHTILLKHRREFHKRVGDVMESLFEEQLEEQAPQLAFHFREAHQYERAMSHYGRAGDVAFRLFANEEAATHYGEALVMARKFKKTIPTEELLHLYIRRGRAFEHLVASNEAKENYQTMLDHAHERQDPELSLAAMIAMSTLLSTQTSIQDVDRSRQLSEESLELAKSLDDQAAEAKIYWNLLNTIAFADGDIEIGLAYGETSLKLARELDLKEQIAYTLNSMSKVYWRNNMLAEGIDLLDEVRVLWRELDNQPMLADSYAMTAFIQLMTGELQSAKETLLELVQISLAINNTWNLSIGRMFLGLCYLEMGEIDDGNTTLAKAIEVSRQAGLYSNELLAKVVLAGSYSLLGLDELAESLAAETIRRIDEVRHYDRPLMFGLACAAFVRSGALSEAKEILGEISEEDLTSGNDWFLAYIVGAEAEIAIADDQLDYAIEHVDTHIDRMQNSGVSAPLPYLLYLKARAVIALGDSQSSIIALENALTVSEKIGERIWRWQILAALVDIASDGDVTGTQNAAEWRTKASETIKFIANSISDADLQRAFLNKPSAASILEAEIVD